MKREEAVAYLSTIMDAYTPEGVDSEAYWDMVLGFVEDLGMLPEPTENPHAIYGDSCNISFGDLINKYCVWEPTR